MTIIERIAATCWIVFLFCYFFNMAVEKTPFKALDKLNAVIGGASFLLSIAITVVASIIVCLSCANPCSPKPKR